MRISFISMLANLWRHRVVLLQLSWRDMRQKYIGSFLGLFWAVIYPLVLLCVYTLVFGKILQIRLGDSTDPFSFALYLFCGLLPWQMVQECMLRGAGSLVDNANIVKKTTFPTEIMPSSLVLSSLVHMALGMVVLLILLVASGRTPGVTVVAILPVGLLQVVFCLGLAYLFAAANAYFRDVGHMANAFSILWFLLTPVVYPVTMLDNLPPLFRFLASLNPVLHIVQVYRDPILNNAWPDVGHLTWLIGETAVLFVIGTAVFGRVRQVVVDVL